MTNKRKEKLIDKFRDGVITYGELSFQNGFRFGKKEGSKETAKKIIEMLKQPPYIDFIESWVIEDIAKEYGIKIGD